ncbi:hypothetical protein [Mycolicibacterium duvalii]|uniref:Chitin-binding protein n=1 Tax=Mycolicibacterium duvalii TaxID=39688 RepID=A0A7I7JWU7_9MYCO|nr:hypothetical protein [Mycolicibacterium duvalii]BBX16310.1 hypothetical protein MDUV_11700 [Mycolicibacterium duvalii]
MKFAKILASAAVTGGLAAGAVGVAATAGAQPEPWPPMPGQPSTADQQPMHGQPAPAQPAGWQPAQEPMQWQPAQPANWAPPPPPPAPPAGPNTGTPPAWAPPKPVDPVWAAGNPQVWDEGWNHWGVWLNGVFVPTF